MIEQGQIWTDGKQKFKVMGFEPSGHVLLFGLTQVDFLPWMMAGLNRY
jgi:hypothetical protein